MRTFIPSLSHFVSKILLFFLLRIRYPSTLSHILTDWLWSTRYNNLLKQFRGIYFLKLSKFIPFLCLDISFHCLSLLFITFYFTCCSALSLPISEKKERMSFYLVMNNSVLVKIDFLFLLTLFIYIILIGLFFTSIQMMEIMTVW